MIKKEVGEAATIDEALTKTHFGKFNYIIIIFSGLVINNVVLECVGISFALPVLECDLNLTYKEQGILGSVGFLGIIASSHLWGFLADTTGRKRILRPALMLECLVNVLSSLSPNFETLAVMRFLNGVLLSAGSASIYAYLGEFHSHKHRNRAILSAAFISASLSIFFPVLAWACINQNWHFYVPIVDIEFRPWRMYMLACGTLAFISTLLLFFLPESPKYYFSIGRADKAIAILEQIHRINTHGNPKLADSKFDVTTLLPDHDIPINSNESKETTERKPQLRKNPIVIFMYSLWNQTAPLFMRKHIRKTVLASVIQYIIFFTAHGVYMWFPYILNSTMIFTQNNQDSTCLCDILRSTQAENLQKANTYQLSSESERSLPCVTKLEISTYKHTIMLELIYVTLLLITSYTIGKFGRTPILFSILLTCGICGVLGTLTNIPLLSIYFLVIFLCCGLGTTVVNAIVVDIYPTNLRAMAVCISLMMGRVGSVSGSSILGILIETNCELALYSSSIALIAAGCLGILLPKAKNEQELVKPSRNKSTNL